MYQSQKGKLLVFISCISILSSVSMTAAAKNLYMNDLKLKSEIDWLNAQGVTQLSTSTWPLTANEISRALATANVSTSAQQQVLKSVQAMVTAESNIGIDANIGLYVQSDRQQLPQTFADDQMAKHQITATV